MGRFKDLTGMTFGMLTVVERAPNQGKRVRWKCRCECGNEVITRGDHLTSGHAKSCGCQQSKNQFKLKHSMSHSRIYRIWLGIKTRCFNPKDKGYKNYGGRGITMHIAWIDDFQAFYDCVSKLEHFGEEGYTLDRIDNNGNYEPNNLRWATSKEQCRNTRQNIIVEYNGQLMTLMDVSEKSGICWNTLKCRIKRGESGDFLFRLPRKKK